MWHMRLLVLCALVPFKANGYVRLRLSIFPVMKILYGTIYVSSIQIKIQPASPIGFCSILWKEALEICFVYQYLMISDASNDQVKLVANTQELCDRFLLQQTITAVTHRRGNTLDLVFTNYPEQMHSQVEKKQHFLPTI